MILLEGGRYRRTYLVCVLVVRFMTNDEFTLIPTITFRAYNLMNGVNDPKQQSTWIQILIRV